MTDNEIVKALECCSTYGGSCSKCPAYVKVDRSNCKKVLRGAVDLINRQKAQIERLTAGIERLADESDARDIDEYNMVCRIRADAIKEFAELVKENSNKTDLVCSGALVKIDYTITEEKLDNLVKEMVGDL